MKSSLFALWAEEKVQGWCAITCKKRIPCAKECKLAALMSKKGGVYRTKSAPNFCEWTSHGVTWSEVGKLVLTPPALGLLFWMGWHMTLISQRLFYSFWGPSTYLAALSVKNLAFLVYSFSLWRTHMMGCVISHPLCATDLFVFLLGSLISLYFSCRQRSNEAWIILAPFLGAPRVLRAYLTHCFHIENVVVKFNCENMHFGNH